MPSLKQVRHRNYQFCKRSGITVDVNRAFSWVRIEDKQGNELFLQSHQADEFISRADDIAAQDEYMPGNMAELVVAYDYLDALGPKL